MECISVYDVLEVTRGHFLDKMSAIDVVIDDSKNKMNLCMGHVKLSLVQTRRIGEIMEEVQNLSSGTSGVCYMDYKIKVEPVRRLESTTQCFGKHGKKWNGAGVFIGLKMKRRWRKCEER